MRPNFIPLNGVDMAMGRVRCGGNDRMNRAVTGLCIIISENIMYVVLYRPSISDGILVSRIASAKGCFLLH